MDKLIENGMKIRFRWGDIDMDVVAIKTIGNYNSYIDHKFTKGTFYNAKTNTMKNYDEMFRELLNNGSCIFNKNYLVFKEGFEKEYEEYVLSYMSGINDKDTLLLNSLKDKSAFSRIKNYIAMFNNGVLKKETLLSIMTENIINMDSISQII